MIYFIWIPGSKTLWVPIVPISCQFPSQFWNSKYGSEYVWTALEKSGNQSFLITLPCHCFIADLLVYLPVLGRRPLIFWESKGLIQSNWTTDAQTPRVAHHIQVFQGFRIWELGVRECLDSQVFFCFLHVFLFRSYGLGRKVY